MNSFKGMLCLLCGVMGLLVFAGEASGVPEGEPLGSCVARDYYGPQTQNETVNIIFLIDGSASIESDPLHGFDLQKEGIRNCFKDINPATGFIESDGTVAVGVIQFYNLARTEIHMSVIDSTATATARRSR